MQKSQKASLAERMVRCVVIVALAAASSTLVSLRFAGVQMATAAAPNAGYYPWHGSVRVTQDPEGCDPSHCVGNYDRYAWDFGNGTSGWSVYASRAGKIGYIDTSNPSGSATANVIVIDFGNGFAAIYMHLAQEVPPRFNVNDQVAGGDLIAFADTTGTDVAHLHFAVQQWDSSWNGIPSKRYQQSVQSVFANEAANGNPATPTCGVNCHNNALNTPYISHIANSGGAKLDNTFSNDGWLTSRVIVSDSVQDLAIQPADGKILAVVRSETGVSLGNFNVLRFNAGGGLDRTFGNNGLVSTDFGGQSSPYAAALQADGKIVVTGETHYAQVGGSDLSVARYNSDGTLDSSFSGDGMLKTHVGGRESSSLGGLAIQSDRKIVVAGNVWDGNSTHMAVYRFTASGGLDRTFSGDGEVTISFGAGRNDRATDLAILKNPRDQKDWKIVIAGSSEGAFPDWDFAVARLNLDGTMDKTFSGDGRQVANLGGAEERPAMAIQADGKIVIAGGTNLNGQSLFAFTRLNFDGSRDTSFGGAGKRLISYGIMSFAQAVIVQPADGKIVAAGQTYNGTTTDFAVMRLLRDGSLDSTLDADGRFSINFGSNDSARALIRDNRGRYILGGSAHLSLPGVTAFALARTCHGASAC